MTLDAAAARFLRACAEGGEAPDGWLYAKPLQQVRLDYTPDSLQRLDQLLTQVRERARPPRAERAAAGTQPPARTIGRMLALGIDQGS